MGIFVVFYLFFFLFYSLKLKIAREVFWKKKTATET